VFRAYLRQKRIDSDQFTLDQDHNDQQLILYIYSVLTKMISLSDICLSVCSVHSILKRHSKCGHLYGATWSVAPRVPDPSVYLSVCLSDSPSRAFYFLEAGKP